MDPFISFTETRKKIYFDKTKSREQLIQDFSQWSQDALDEITRLERRNKASNLYYFTVKLLHSNVCKTEKMLE